MLIIKKRIEWLDTLKFFAIFMVLWGHCIQHLLSSNPLEEPLYRIIYSFHMPLFMMISGFFMYKGKEVNFFQFLIKRFKQLLLPVFSITSIWLIINSLHLGGGNPFYWFWFLKSAFICSITYQLVIKTGKYHRIALLLTLVMSQFITALNLNIMYPSFILGILLNQFNYFFLTKKTKIFILSGCVFLILLIFKETMGTGSLYEFIKGTDILSKIYRSSIVKFYPLIMGLSGALFFYYLFMTLDRHLSSNKIWNYCCMYGKCTLGIYLIQTFIIEIFLAYFLKLDELPFLLFNFIISPIISLIVLTICIWIMKLIQLSKYSSLLFLGIQKA